jgi:hypothetical protein
MEKEMKPRKKTHILKVTPGSNTVQSDDKPRGVKDGGCLPQG